MTQPHIPFARPDITNAEVEAISQVVRSGWLTTGPATKEFENEFAAFLGTGLEAVAVNSATAGLHLACEAAGIGPGDEVLVPTWTFTATAEVVRYLGAEPILVDVDPETLCLDLDQAAAAITPRTKAFMPVHFAGYAMDLAKLRAFADDHGLFMIEDAAHSLPSMSGGQLVGADPHGIAVFSFYATKTLATGEGGMVITRDKAMAARMRTMRLHGIDRDVFNRYSSNVPSWFYEVVAPGYKYNMPDTAAALGRVQLGRLQEMRDRRAEIAGVYDAAFADLPLRLPAHADAAGLHSWHLYVIRLNQDAPLDRNTFIEQMSVHGVGCSVHFIPLHLQPYWRDRGGLSPQDFPVASAEFDRVVSLPIYSAMTDTEVDRVVAAVRAVLGDR